MSRPILPRASPPSRTASLPRWRASSPAADRARARRGLPAAQVLVQARGFEFTSGDRSRRFHAASVGKSMTATRAFQLAEAGALDLSAPITDLLPEADWRGLFVRDGRDHAAAVTTRHLLTHTSGVADYFEGRVTGGLRFGHLLVREPDRLWTPADLLAFSRDHQRPVAEPGRRFSYSDTGYVLLGRVIEHVGGATLGAQLHEGIFAPAGMAHSCLLFHTLPGGAPSEAADPAAQLDIAPLRLGRRRVQPSPQPQLRLGRRRCRHDARRPCTVLGGVGRGRARGRGVAPPDGRHPQQLPSRHPLRRRAHAPALRGILAVPPRTAAAGGPPGCDGRTRLHGARARHPHRLELPLHPRDAAELPRARPPHAAADAGRCPAEGDRLSPGAGPATPSRRWSAPIPGRTGGRAPRARRGRAGSARCPRSTRSLRRPARRRRRWTSPPSPPGA